jgi:hypothetical protein
LEPIFEADFHDGSFGYRPKRTAQQAVDRVAEAIVRHKTRGIDVDLAAYFDSVRHDRLLAKVAHRMNDRAILHLLKLILKASGTRGLPQGGVGSPLLSNIYLTEVDAMLERAKAVTRNGAHTYVEYVRYADDRARPKPLLLWDERSPPRECPDSPESSGSRHGRVTGHVVADRQTSSKAPPRGGVVRRPGTETTR